MSSENATSVSLQDDSLEILEAAVQFLWGVLHLKGSLIKQSHNWILCHRFCLKSSNGFYIR